VNLACDQVICPSGGTTSITGTVYDPAGVNPLYNVFVYVPNGTVAPFVDGATCDKCADALSGYPLVTTKTDVTGHFELDNMPVGANIPVVIQTGKWRRQITVTTTKCGSVVVDPSLTHFPQTKAQGDIPRMALSTGGADPLECILRKIGIADSEFSNAGDGGRVTLYQGSPYAAVGEVNAATGDYFFIGSSPSAGKSFDTSDTLWASQSSLMAYDMVLLGCEGGEYGDPSVETNGTKTPDNVQAMQDYVSAGGRVFASHYHYYWIEGSTTTPESPTPWSSIASWYAGPTEPTHYLYSCTSGAASCDTITDTINTGVGIATADALATWLVNAGGSTVSGQVPITEGRHSVNSLNTTLATEFIYAKNEYEQLGSSSKYSPVSHATQYFSFNAPVGDSTDAQCGRFVFSDIHVSSGDSTGADFPNGCTTSGMTPQEKALEFLIFDLASRVCDPTVPQPPPTCVKQTCSGLGLSCGPAADGCGGALDCGTCVAPATCGGGGTAGVCGTYSCVPKTCAEVGFSCGVTGDGCGNTLSCGTCTPPATCGGGGTPGTCGAVTCTPKSCAEQGFTCGSTGDGCGNALECGTCTPPASCGGGGTPGSCGVVSCTPQTCGSKCGPQGDGCGGVLTCPTCPTTGCVPTTCAAAGAACGPIGDGCGGVLNCGTCTAPATCGGGGTPYQCGGGVH
jgi:hypothetical protein